MNLDRVAPAKVNVNAGANLSRFINKGNGVAYFLSVALEANPALDPDRPAGWICNMALRAVNRGTGIEWLRSMIGKLNTNGWTVETVDEAVLDSSEAFAVTLSATLT